jgi:hypothetical protein
MISTLAENPLVRMYEPLVDLTISDTFPGSISTVFVLPAIRGFGTVPLQNQLALPRDRSHPCNSTFTSFIGLF